MSDSIKGLELCRGFFFDEAKPILDKYFPHLLYTAGLIGYGSDVLGYDDEVSRDHMWGPQFYLFLTPEDLPLRERILETFSHHLPYTYRGYSVNFTPPDPNDNGVRHPQLISSGQVDPLIFIQSFESFLSEQLGTAAIMHLSDLDFLTISEHRLLSLVSGELFHDRLGLSKQLDHIRCYPDSVRRYLIASHWDIIASEQAFVRRCADVGDDVGSVIICARIAERLMRLCFLYRNRYAPYSKWFGTAFRLLDVDNRIKEAIDASVHAADFHIRETKLVEAQALVAALHNESGITAPVDFRIESYYGRDIRVIFADKFAEATAETLKDTVFENVPLIGSFSAMGGLSNVSDEQQYYETLKRIYVPSSYIRTGGHLYDI